MRHVTIESAAWRGDPLRVGLLSDTHVGGPHMPARRVARIVARMNGERPDLVVLLGDYVDGHRGMEDRSAAQNAEIAQGIRAFAQLRAPLGVIAAWGNHDWWYGGAAIEAAFDSAGVPLIENGSVQLQRADGPIAIADLGDFLSPNGPPSFTAALASVAPDARVFAITHRPDAFADAPPQVALTLAGHTHCGQFNFQPVNRLWLPGAGSRRWPCGLYEEQGRHLFVTGGVGESVIPARFNAPPEIVIVTLRARP